MKNPTFVVYRDHSGQYRWRLVARNNLIIADSGESYTRRRDVLRAIDTVLMAIFDADVMVEQVKKPAAPSVDGNDHDRLRYAL